MAEDAPAVGLGGFKIKFKFGGAAVAPVAVPEAAPLSAEEAAARAEKKRRKRERKARERAAAEAAAAAGGGSAQPAGEGEGGGGSHKRKRETEGGPPSASAPRPHQLEACLLRLTKLDREGYFQAPVSDALAPGYSALVRHPMDFSTMRRKLQAGAYGSWDALGGDVAQIVANCLLYNKAETVYAAAARRLGAAAKRVVQGYKEPSGTGTRPEAPKAVAPPVARVAKVPQAAPARPALPPRPAPRPVGRPVSRPAPARAPPQPPRPPMPAYRPAASAGLALQDGRRALSVDENRRASFRPRGTQSRLPTFHGDLPLNCYAAPASVQPGGPMAPVALRASQGLGAPDGYARSLARFAAQLGPTARKLVLARAAMAVDPLPASLPALVLPQWPRAATSGSAALPAARR